MNTTARVIRTKTESQKIDCAGVEAGAKMLVGLAMLSNLLGQKGKRTEKITGGLSTSKRDEGMISRPREPPEFDVIVPQLGGPSLPSLPASGSPARSGGCRIVRSRPESTSHP